MYRANLSFDQLNEYLSFLQELGFLIIMGENPRTIYKTTEIGINYLKDFEKVKAMEKNR